MIWRDPFLRPVAADPRQQRGFRAESMEAPVVLVGRAPRLLEELVDQRLADARCHVLVNRIQRLAHGFILLRRQRDDLALAGFLDLRQRLVVFLFRWPVAVGGGFLHVLFATWRNL